MILLKKLLSVFLAFVMVLVAIPLYGIQSVAVTSGDFSYEPIDSTTAELTGYSGQGGDVVIPSEIEGYTVVSLGDSLFGDETNDYINTSVTSLYIPSSVANIDMMAVIPLISCSEYVVDADNDFYVSEDGVLFNKSKSLIIRYPCSKQDSAYLIPEGVTEIGFASFGFCLNLKEVVFSNSVETISGSAFASSPDLSSVLLSDSISEIGSYTFVGCASIERILIPESITDIADDAFDGSALDTVIGVPNSYAESFANTNSYSFIDVNSLNTTGDVNFNNIRNECDLDLMMRIASGSYVPSDLQASLGDVNNDGVVDGFDIAALDVKIYADIDN